MQNLKRGIIYTTHFSKGFTLAETLITLVIVGVIAAITVPTLIAKYQKEQTVTKLKKAYNVLSQAVRLSEIDNGITDTWDYSISVDNFFKKYLKKYLISAKDFGFINLNSLGIEYKVLSGTKIQAGTDLVIYDNNYRITLNDGTLVFFDNYQNSNKYRTVYVDINGFKKPNQVGKDLFVFTIQSKYKFTPWGMGATQPNAIITPFGDRNVIKQANNRFACNKNKDGYWCAALIMVDGWQIKDDYPW